LRKNMRHTKERHSRGLESVENRERQIVAQIAFRKKRRKEKASASSFLPLRVRTSEKKQAKDREMTKRSGQRGGGVDLETQHQDGKGETKGCRKIVCKMISASGICKGEQHAKERSEWWNGDESGIWEEKTRERKK